VQWTIGKVKLSRIRKHKLKRGKPPPSLSLDLRYRQLLLLVREGSVSQNPHNGREMKLSWRTELTDVREKTSLHDNVDLFLGKTRSAWWKISKTAKLSELRGRHPKRETQEKLSPRLKKGKG